MPRDYSRNKNDRSSGRRDYRRNSSESSSGISWLLIGVLVGLCIAGIAYLNQSKNHNGVENNPNAQQQMAINQTTAPTTAKKTTTNSPHFDFYNMLPSSQVSAPNATDDNDEQTTSDNVEHTSTPPNPAKVNAILSGITPPPANANLANNANTNNTNENANQNANTNSNQNNNSKQTTAQPISANSVDDNGDIISVPKNTSSENSTPATTAQSADNNAQQTKPINTTTTAQNSSAYVIQLAAFLHYQQADQYKAQLALSGYEAKIVSFQKNGKTLQRVWIGPYPSLTAAAVIQRQLAANEIKSTLLRVNAQ